MDLIWALWIASGGIVNGGYLSQPAPVAYFYKLEECERVRLAVKKLSNATSQCIQAAYNLK